MHCIIKTRLRAKSALFVDCPVRQNRMHAAHAVDDLRHMLVDNKACHASASWNVIS